METPQPMTSDTAAVGDVGEPGDWLTIAAASRLAGITRPSIDLARRLGAFPSLRGADGRWRVPRTTFLAWRARVVQAPQRRHPLSWDAAAAIRARYAAGSITYRQLAAAYGVSHETIRQILTGRTWRHP